MLQLTASKLETGYGLCRKVEQFILDQRVRGPSDSEPIFVCQAFPYQAGYPSDPWSAYAKGFKDRVIEKAREIGIEIVLQ